MCTPLMGASFWTWRVVRAGRIARMQPDNAALSAAAHTGIGVTSTGHSHPAVVKAIQDQAASMIFAQQNIFPASKPMVCICTARGLASS